MQSSSGKHLLDIFRKACSSETKLMMGLLKYNPATRLTAEEALSSDYFSKLVCAFDFIICQ